MAKTSSKRSERKEARKQRKLAAAETKKQQKTAKQGSQKSKLNKKFVQFRKKRDLRKAERVQPHRSFRRTYREDYRRELKVPGMMYHIFATFKVIFKNWKLFLPLLVLAVVINVAMVGLMSESTYRQFQEVLEETNVELAGGQLGTVPKAGLLLVSSLANGGLSGNTDETGVIFMVIVFLLLWLTTIYLLRQKLAGHKIKLRDGLYNAPQPLISTFVVFAVAVVQCLPIMILVIAYSAAVTTDFLATPFYALLFFVFGAAMVLLSGYLLSSSLIALVAVSAPGLYPLKALQAASDLMAGRRFRFILRLLAGVLTLIVVWAVVMLPIVLFDLFIKQFEWTTGFPLVPLCLNIMTCFTVIYATAYLYLYYRWMLDFEEEK